MNARKRASVQTSNLGLSSVKHTQTLTGLISKPARPSSDSSAPQTPHWGAIHVRGRAMVDEAAIDQAVTVIAALADRTRLRIMAVLRGRELRSGDLHRRLGITQPLTSYHLRVLAEAGLVRSRKVG